MINNDFIELSKAIFGGGWQSASAQALGVNNRTVRRWITGEHQPPDRVIDELAEMLAEKQFPQIIELIQSIEAKHGTPESIPLAVYGADSNVQSMHQRPWTFDTDRLIKLHMADMLQEAGYNAVIDD